MNNEEFLKKINIPNNILRIVDFNMRYIIEDENGLDGKNTQFYIRSSGDGHNILFYIEHPHEISHLSIPACVTDVSIEQLLTPVLASINLLTIPASIQSMSTSFSNVIRAKHVEIINGNERLCSFLLYNQIILENLEIPESVKYIDEFFAKNCASLKEVIFNGPIETIERSAFEGCIDLKKIVFKDLSHLKSISPDAFKRCPNLKIPPEIRLFMEAQ